MKKIYFLMMALVCAFVANAYTVYLNPAGGEWSQNNEKYAVWAWSDGGEGSWYGMSAVGNGLYETEIPDANTNLIFVRMDKNKEGYSWDNKWDQTNNLSYDGTNNLYTITGKENSGNYNGLGEWSSYVVEDLVFTVTVPEGTENCYITGTFNNWTGFLQMEKVEGADNKFTITIDDLVKNSVQYKYLCSDSWDYVEVKANGGDTDNRTYNEEDVVEKWKATPISTAIESIEAENAPVEYYNLQGVKVANPENGLFIKKQGNKAVKVIL